MMVAGVSVVAMGAGDSDGEHNGGSGSSSGIDSGSAIKST